MECLGLILTMAAALASSSLRIRVGRDTNRVCGGASRNLASLNTGNGSIREKQALSLLCLLLLLRYGLFEMRLCCINGILFQQDSLVANCHSCCCRENSIASFGHNQDEVIPRDCSQGPDWKQKVCMNIPWENCGRPERFALKGSEVQSAWWRWKCYYLQTSKDFHGFLTFTVGFNALMRMVRLFGV